MRPLRNIVFKTFLSTLICSIVVSLIWLEAVELTPKARKSDFYGLAHIMIIFCSFIMSLCTLTIFINRLDTVRNNAVLSGLSFFFLPLSVWIAIGLTSFDIQEIRLWAVVFISFLLPLTYYFITYRKRL
ncbi:hypothetical protein [Chitinophaga arvensicola]|uniref:Uncharacterized protein n=1 Tax=Chitinophaga arvensicola TaxID=29529 RepID=A0A1I0R3Q7_9BACT|nr:hypothetical protein [Chitinophaga arvensicola]SEW35088.1 hypothetical protein SAMN04488122_2181 [Chitinophaga arvensicola]